MELMLKTAISDFPFKLGHGDKCFLAGSCFAENIGLMMQQRGFNVLSNPWGILFNPISIAELMECATGLKNDFSIQPVRRDEVFVSLFQHSRLFGQTENELSGTVQVVTDEARQFCREANTFIITFGTANVFVEKASGRVVANCHKQPSAMFERKMLHVEEILKPWYNIISANPEQRFIFTVSPVRHSRDGLMANNLSKATLLLAVHHLCASFPEQCFYFPSYEIVIDELRDYRFFKEDMVHPNETAIKYVWEKWESSVYSNDTIVASNRYLKLVQQALHRPLFEHVDKSTPASQRFLLEADVLKNLYNDMNFKYLYNIFSSMDK